MATPDDLKDTSAPDKTDNNFYLVTVDDLTPSETYKFQFAWIYPDKRAIGEDDWSITKTVTASTEAQPNPPQFLETDLTSDTEKIFVQWNGVDSAGNPYKGIDRVEVFISDASDTFGDGTTPVTFFKVAGKKSITAPAGDYTVYLKAVTLAGTYSESSDEQTVTVDAQGGETIESPTLPTGLTAESIAFGLKVNWGGQYSGGSSFTGFKSINIYAVNSNLGSTTTSGITSSNQVATLAVNDTPNASNIPLGTYVGYSQDTYLYYISVNALDVGYQSGGVTTYTRINSSALRPSKANFIDLASGVISIENLVAGNGQFQSWLRAGAWDGARVEISGLTNSITDPNHSGTTIYPGIAIWDSSGSTRSFYSDSSGNVTITGTINATDGYIGSSTQGWNITEYGLLANGSFSIIDLGDVGIIDVGSGFIELGSYTMTGAGGSFNIYETVDVSGTPTPIDIVNTDYTGRVILGSESSSGRQVEVGRSAQVAGSANSNSGGLRNMYTIAEGNYTSTVYLSDKTTNGDVLLVYDTTS